jgi:hypothetical protein
MLRRMQSAGNPQSLNTVGAQRLRRDRAHHGHGVQGVGRHIEFDEVDDLAAEEAAQVTGHGVGDTHGDKPNRHGAVGLSLAGSCDCDVGDFAGERGVSGIRRVDECDTVFEVQRVDDVGLALM